MFYDGARYWRLDQPGCPLCQAARAAELRHLDWFLIENYNSLPALIHLETARYCRRHAAQLKARSEDGQFSSTFSYLVQAEGILLRKYRKSLANHQSSYLRRHVPPPTIPGSAQVADAPIHCPACEAGQNSAAVESYLLLRNLETESGRTAYTASDGLCRSHLWLVLREASVEVADWLTADAERRLMALQEEFELYFHRLDYRFHAEPRGREQDAWERALRFFWEDISVDEPCHSSPETRRIE